MGYGHGGQPVLIWIWLVLAAILVGVPAVVIITAVALRARASRTTLRTAGQPAGAAKAHVAHVTWCGLAGLAVGALTGVALIIDNRGGVAVLTCAGGYLAGLLLGEFTAQPPARGSHRTARLLARRPADYVPRWAVAAAILAAAPVLAAPVAFALAPSVRYGSSHPVPGASVVLPGGQTSWPPVFPGTAAAAALVLVVLGVGAAGLHRIAARPSPAADGAGIVADVLRRQAGSAIVGAVLGLEMLVLAALLISGSSGLAVPDAAAAPDLYAGSRVMIFTGLGCAIAGLAAWLVLSGWIRRPVSWRAGEEPNITPGP